LRAEVEVAMAAAAVVAVAVQGVIKNLPHKPHWLLVLHTL
jgi:hypothetical protein